MEKSSKLKVIGLTLAGLSVLASGSAMAASLKVGGGVQSDFVWFDDEVNHPNKNLGYGHGNLSFDNQSNVTSADVYLRGTLMDRWTYGLSVGHDVRDGRVDSDGATDELSEARRGGPAVMDAWVGWDRFDPWARFSLGRMNVSQGLENSGNRSAYTFIAPAAGQRSFVVGRGDGLTVEGNPARWLGYQAGVYYTTTNVSAQGAAPGTGANIDTSSQVVVSNMGNHLGMWSGRLFVQPYVMPGKVLHLGGNYAHVGTKGDVSVNVAPGGYFSNANAQMLRLSSANGRAVAPTAAALSRTNGYNVWSVEGLGMMGAFSLQGEYTHFDLDLDHTAKTDVFVNNTAGGANNLKADGWYLQAGWVITGESRNYDPVSGTLGKLNPRNAKWGAWELAGRYDKVDLSKTAKVTGQTGATPTGFCGDSNSTGAGGCTNGGKMEDWTVALNWYPNKNVKLAANYTSAEATYAKTAAGSGPTLDNTASTAARDHKRTVNVVAVKGQVDF